MPSSPRRKTYLWAALASAPICLLSIVLLNVFLPLDAAVIGALVVTFVVVFGVLAVNGTFAEAVRESVRRKQQND